MDRGAGCAGKKGIVISSPNTLSDGGGGRDTEETGTPFISISKFLT